MSELTKTLKLKRNYVVTPERIKGLRKWVKNDCKVQFILWAEGTSLDITGIHQGEPVFRPAICAWEAWKAAWAHKSSNAAHKRQAKEE